jgi:hypothetical protein
MTCSRSSKSWLTPSTAPSPSRRLRPSRSRLHRLLQPFQKSGSLLHTQVLLRIISRSYQPRTHGLSSYKRRICCSRQLPSTARQFRLISKSNSSTRPRLLKKSPCVTPCPRRSPYAIIPLPLISTTPTHCSCTHVSKKAKISRYGPGLRRTNELVILETASQENVSQENGGTRTSPLNVIG